MPLGRYPTPKRIGRTLEEHHEDVERLAQYAAAQFSLGRLEIAVQLTVGDLLRLKFNPPTRPELRSAIPLLAYWMAYWEIDGLMRELRPIAD